MIRKLFTADRCSGYTDNYAKIQHIDWDFDKKATVNIALAFLDVPVLIAIARESIETAV
ncbi:MAG: hypothetical protein ACFKPT_08675 [Gloeotrichia echinulata GP01]